MPNFPRTDLAVEAEAIHRSAAAVTELPREILTEFHRDHRMDRMIDFIHATGLKVMLRPMRESHDGNGRLQVRFPDDRERIPGKVSDC